MTATLDASHIEATLDALLEKLEAGGASRQLSYRMIFRSLSLKALSEGGAEFVDNIADDIQQDATTELENDNTGI